ncbi:nitroreductase family protein [Romboutsia sp.]|uniref:nitroreductase family protein n=1 Tax=Romboutsia sp. TaxID=1965302 RepID=UPI003F372C1B
MNAAIKSILNRRSVREFKEEMLKEEEIKVIVEAGIYAPSAMNQQSWHLTINCRKAPFFRCGDERQGLKLS